jgi:hypothetical protein
MGFPASEQSAGRPFARTLSTGEIDGSGADTFAFVIPVTVAAEVLRHTWHS